MTVRYTPPLLLADDHDISNFECTSAEQTRWLLDFARSSHANGATKVFVVTEHNSPAVIAYYAWRMAEVKYHDAPQRMTKGAGKYPQPVVLLARLGVHGNHEKRGIGAALLRDAILRMVNIGASVGCRGLLVHCESPEAKAFYTHLIPGFMESPTDPLHLVLLMKDVRALLTNGF